MTRPRIIALIDMDAFFASIEQHDNPFLMSRAVVVINHQNSSTIISCSYEARFHGIRVGDRLWEAKKKCPYIIIKVSRSKRYTYISDQIMLALYQHVSPDIEQSSVDEAYIDLTHIVKLYDNLEHIATHIQTVIYNSSGLSASVGIGSNKTLAKYAAKQNKPNGFFIIPEQDSQLAIADIPVSELCGIGPGFTKYLNQLGVHFCGDIKKIPISVLSRKFGRIGRRIWFMCLGKDPDLVSIKISLPKSIGHSKVLPPMTCDQRVLQSYFHFLILKTVHRLRIYSFKSANFFIGMRSKLFGWKKVKITLLSHTNDSKVLYESCFAWIIKAHQEHEVITQIFIRAVDIVQFNQVSILESKSKKIHKTLDEVHNKYGIKSLVPAKMIHHHKDLRSIISFGYHQKKPKLNE